MSAQKPTEAGRYLDAFGNTWRLWNDGLFAMLGNSDADPDRYGPWKRLVVEEEPEWEYGWHTGSTVSLIGRRDQVEEWLAVRGWKLGEGDWGQRVMRRHVAGSWMPAEQERAENE